MRPFSMRCYYVLLSMCMFVLLSACPLLQNPVLDDTGIDYSAREIEYSRYVDPSEWYLEPVESRMYSESGRLDGVFRNYYEAFHGSDYWLLVKTEVFTITADGSERMSEYYVYEYIEDTYTMYDEEDQAYIAVAHLLSRGEVYGPDDFLYNYYEVEYEISMPNQPDLYTRITDYSYDGDTDTYDIIGEQTSTYRIVYSGEIFPGEAFEFWDYVTEKVFLLSPDGTELELNDEFASWYDEFGFWTHELYHTVRSSEENGNEVYYFTKYDWNDSFQVYSQQDFLYDPAEIPLRTAADHTNGSFDENMIADYILDFEAIGALQETLLLSYDDLGNITQRLLKYHGTEHEKVVYRYNTNSEEVSMQRYVRGQSSAYDREETRFREEFRDDVYYRIRDKMIYSSYDNTALRSVRTADYHIYPWLRSAQRPLRRVRSNHER